VNVEQNNSSDVNVWSLYLYALKSPVTIEKYQARLKKFFDFLGLKGVDLEEKSKYFIKEVENNGNQ
jgi:hypothetical protein